MIVGGGWIQIFELTLWRNAPSINIHDYTHIRYHSEEENIAKRENIFLGKEHFRGNLLQQSTLLNVKVCNKAM